MNLPLIFTLIVVLSIFLFIIKLWLNKLEVNSKLGDELVEWLKSSTTQTDRKLSESMKQFNERLDKAAFVIASVQKNIGEFSEIGRSMKDLQEFINSPKLRGNIGEQILKELLSQYFPKGTYSLQYSFKNGERVDAVIKTSQGLIPIDSKFPLDNFRKMNKAEDTKTRDALKKEFFADVKKHITDISKKYILTVEGTVDYAIMYIPSENIYYEIINSTDLFDYAGSARVLPVSPMSFYAYMKAILMSFDGTRIAAKAKEILNTIRAMQKDFEKTDESLSILTKHITNAYNQTFQVTKSLSSLGQKLSSTRTLSDKEEQNKLIE